MKFDYRSKKWKALAGKAMRRDGYMCQLSKRYGKQVSANVVHHIYPADEHPEYAYCLWNLISLSRAMHNTLHDRNTNKLTEAGVALMRRTSPLLTITIPCKMLMAWVNLYKSRAIFKKRVLYMQLIKKKLDEIHPYDKNPRRNDGAVDAVSESIRQCGYILYCTSTSRLRAKNIRP